MTFGVWLKKEAPKDPDARAIQTFAATQPPWPYESELLSDYLDIVAANVTEAQRRDLLSAVGRAYQRRAETNAPRARGFWAGALDTLRANFGTLLLAVFGIIIAFILAWGIFNPRFLTSLAEPEQARGLITFLFAFSTIAIFLLVAIATFWMEKSDAETRFPLVKDLLTILIGVLGTILGFYFGSLATEQEGGRGMYLANVATSAPIVAPGESAEITGVVLGGESPYGYDIAFSDPTGRILTRDLAVHAETEDGAIRAEVTIPADVTPPASVAFTLTARDANGTLAQSVGSLFVEAPRPAPKPASDNAGVPPPTTPPSEQQ